MTPEQREKDLAEVRAIGERLKQLRESLPTDSPLSKAAFQTAALAGRIEAVLNGSRSTSEEERHG